MKTRRPTAVEIDELTAFLPRLYAEGFQPIVRWGGGVTQADGSITMPWPEYEKIVSEFFALAGSQQWSDFGYEPGTAGRMLQDAALVAAASLDQVKTMLTFCVRGERFCDGHWGAMIEEGHIRRLLERLVALRPTVAAQEAAAPDPPHDLR